MKYPWVSISILGIWIASAIVVAKRADTAPEVILAIALASTIVVSFIGFRTPR
ncbi:MAG: hypothetical protein HYU35_01310 [Parcubacteria group bacterium]|nr:hypothetical protein [Parcubacteria group bacterium]